MGPGNWELRNVSHHPAKFDALKSGDTTILFCHMKSRDRMIKWIWTWSREALHPKSPPY